MLEVCAAPGSRLAEIKNSQLDYNGTEQAIHFPPYTRTWVGFVSAGKTTLSANFLNQRRVERVGA